MVAHILTNAVLTGSKNVMKIFFEMRKSGDWNNSTKPYHTIFDTEEKDKNGMTAIHHAIHRSDMYAVNALVKLGADLDETDSYGRNSYFLAKMLYLKDPKNKYKENIHIYFVTCNTTYYNIGKDKQGKTPEDYV